MAKHKQKSKDLKRIGWWATLLWAVSGLYLVLVFWLAKDYFIENVEGWGQAVSQAYDEKSILQWLLVVIVAGWIVCGIEWLKALKQSGMSYREGLKDLFFTLR